MLPKRKIIKKRHSAARQPTIQTSQPAPASLLEQLKSIDTKKRQQGLAFVASMCNFKEGSHQKAILSELISILYQGNMSLVNQCVFALANLCELEEWVCPKLFEVGLDKALIQLKSNEKQLLKPILVLMIALHDKMPKEFQYLQLGMQSSITPAHLDSNCGQLILQFLIRTNAKSLNKQAYTKIYSVFTNTQKFKLRSMSLAILLRNDELGAKEELIKDALSYIEELICDIDLENEYKVNIMNKKSITKGNNSGQTEQMDQEQMEIQEQIQEHPNYETFIDTVDGIQLLYEIILYSIEELSEDFQDQSDEDDEGVEQEKNIQIGTLYNPELHKHFLNIFQKNPIGLFKNLQLSFPEGINIVSLSLRFLTCIHQSFSQQTKNQVIVFLFKNMENIIQNPPSIQILEQIITVSLYILLKLQIPAQFNNILLLIGENILKPKEQYKNCWLILLEIYSNCFNPEKTHVTLEQNQRIGQILKNLLINIPQINLQQWRAQVIDTIFDVYSNESFDKMFVELGFASLLQVVLERAGTKKNKKFIRQVLFDITRFLQYKKKMIKF